MKKKSLFWVGIIVMFSANIATADEWFVGNRWVINTTDIAFHPEDSTKLFFSGVVSDGYQPQIISVHFLNPKNAVFDKGDKIDIEMSTTLPGLALHYSYIGGRSLSFNFKLLVYPSELGRQFSLVVTKISVFHAGNGYWERIDGFSTDPGIPVAVDNSPLHQPASFTLCQNYPNPFNSSTTIRFALAQPGEVQLAVYSVNGQLVRTLATGYQSAGTHQVVWDGCDNLGQPVPTGIYLYRLITAAGQTAVKKLNLLK